MKWIAVIDKLTKSVIWRCFNAPFILGLKYTALWRENYSLQCIVRQDCWNIFVYAWTVNCNGLYILLEHGLVY